MEDLNSFFHSREWVRILGVLAIRTVKCYTLGQKKEENSLNVASATKCSAFGQKEEEAIG
jgi:hypothetical protein